MSNNDKKDQHNKNPAHDTSAQSQSASHAQTAMGQGAQDKSKLTGEFFKIKEDGGVEWLGAKDASQAQAAKADGVVFSRKASSEQDKQDHKAMVDAVKDSPHKMVVDGEGHADPKKMVEERVRSQKNSGHVAAGAHSQTATAGNLSNAGAAGPGNVNPPPSADKAPMAAGSTNNTSGPLGSGGAAIAGVPGPQAGDGGEPMPGTDAMGHLADGTPTTTNLNANNPPGVTNPENMNNTDAATQPEKGQEPLLSHHGQPLQRPR